MSGKFDANLHTNQKVGSQPPETMWSREELLRGDVQVGNQTEWFAHEWGVFRKYARGFPIGQGADSVDAIWEIPDKEKICISIASRASNERILKSQAPHSEKR